MLAVRVLFGLVGILIVLSLLGYAVSRDPRWLRFANLGLKSGMALVGIMLLVYFIERVLIAI
ncbi:hypothetical protein EZJ19_04615 [Parasulfuritortus cantonensis]|uniref:Uncharacterized protein n=1 Tax=Parasulfuritortus cantonensis TaxID=2528202 RepID=A0A4R1BJ85_9PROT|nr:hypothetical protein [Parasulfuritortus cantonensis]TCJ17238.1 hypothetical protein EZJ19_04615 [Parasulfuritortus cantonensis]